MKNIEQDKLEKLLEIVPSSPALRIAHFTDEGEEYIEILNKFCQNREYEYQINCTNKSFFDFLNEKYKETNSVKPINFSLQRPRYMIQGKIYEYVFVTAKIEKEIRSDFIKRVHSIIKNSGNIIIFLPKGSYEERYSWIELLEEHYYVASNTIDDLFENYDVLISKKMHGWGG
jgi:ADP-heptose:LPS heptosyltransferase